MAEELSLSKARTEAIKAMGCALGELYDILSNQVIWVHLKWKEYRKLFGTDQRTVDFLNTAAPAFFAELQEILWNDILLHLCRLTDPPKSAGKGNLTIALLPNVTSESRLTTLLTEAIIRAKEKTGFAREWRNRRLAHREFPDSLSARSRSLSPGSRQNIEDALASLRTVLNLVESHYMGSSVMYEHSIEALGGVDALLRCLNKGVEEKRRRLGK
jgi:hypothetical protein